MAEITKKRVGELLRGVFEILLEHQDGLPAKRFLPLKPVYYLAPSG